ncbi:SRPBCC family protein [Amycolatopsis pittospori]|uniref:SRPBCC family protein n=1 Tax=Amycolatopsis pittospori TaxID=2749434 RepID=UPI0015F017AC|nr:SRPBCC family protein [Amycolatopsis pittospori]
MSRKALYVETVIRTDLDTLWRHTQDPGLHERWDLRFARIEPVPGSPGRFRYATKFLGIVISGTGTHAGESTRPDGGRTSALRFASADPMSLIRSGSGYWRYTPTEDGVRFVTGFDYATRWGVFGRFADLLFRPLFGWMTAWSFDRLRLWLESGVPPEELPLLAPSASRCSRSPRAGEDGVAPRVLDTLEQA